MQQRAAGADLRVRNKNSQYSEELGRSGSIGGDGPETPKEGRRSANAAYSAIPLLVNMLFASSAVVLASQVRPLASGPLQAQDF